MSTVDDGGRSGEPTFADVRNEFGLTRHQHRADHEYRAAQLAAQFVDEPDGENASAVRAYAWTGGRTRTELALEIETLVSISSLAEQVLPTLRTEHQSVAELCRASRSVAEVAALLSLPLGVVRVLLGDMASLGLIEVHHNPPPSADGPDLALLQRVLHGLNNLRTGPAVLGG